MKGRIKKQLHRLWDVTTCEAMIDNGVVDIKPAKRSLTGKQMARLLTRRNYLQIGGPNSGRSWVIYDGGRPKFNKNSHYILVWDQDDNIWVRRA